MTIFKTNLLNGVPSLAFFSGIGRGMAAPAARTEPVLAPPARSAKKAETDDDDTLDNDDDALEDDNDGKDAPDDSDDAETAAAKRTRRRARKAKRIKDEKSKKAEGDGDDGDAEMRGGSPLALARLRERQRCAAIFASEGAADNIEMAAHLAFNTNQTRTEAIATLEAAPKGGGMARAMNAYAGHRAGHDVPGGNNPAKAAAANWDAALSRKKGR
jgi:hypothetical protein